MKKSIWQKQLPTLLGIGVLIISLVIGVSIFTLGGGLGQFSPRATPQTTPKKIKVTNVTDSGFTISFLTDEKTAGFVKYGTESNAVKSQTGDDRDQLSGTIGSYGMHHITVRGLQPNTTYYYMIGTGSNVTFDNEGQPFTITTAKRNGAPSAAKTAYGNVLNETSTPADGAVVYVTIEGVGEMSSLVKNSGSWAVPLSNARLADGSGYAQLEDNQSMLITVQGDQANQTASYTTTIADSQPVASLTLGAGGGSVAQATASPSPSPSASPSPDAIMETTEDTTATSSAMDKQLSLSELIDTTSTKSADVSLEASQSADANRTISINSTGEPTLTSNQPKIVGQAKPNVVISIEVNSDTQITQELTTDENGEYELDIEQLSQVLEPGEHTVTVTYTDPDTGQLVTETKTFYIEAPTTSEDESSSVSQFALADTSSDSESGPYGTGKPYSIGGVPSSTTSATASPSSRTTMPSTSSAIPVSGSVGTTIALLVGGLFFIIAGIWSFWIAHQLHEEEIDLIV